MNDNDKEMPSPSLHPPHSRSDLRRWARSDRSLRGYRRFMAILTLPFLLGASSDKWIQLADHDRIFAKGLATDGVRFGPRFMDEVIVGNVSQFGCNARPSKLAGLDAAHMRQIRLYSE